MIPALRWLFAALVAAALAYVILRVDLTARVESDFFFARSANAGGKDPFVRPPPQVILSIAAPDIEAPEYRERIRALADELRAIPGVRSTDDLAHGPQDLKDAYESPFFSRYLIAEDRRSTQMFVNLAAETDGTIPSIEATAARHRRPDFDIAVSGVPYVIHHITKRLFHDLQVFSVATLGAFTLLVLLLFRSFRILAGTLVACLASSILTILLLRIVGQPFGILSGNVLTIAFVLCLSHIVFLTVNWERDQGALGAAVRDTVGPSFWSMATTLVSFLTLLAATAKPLREFGFSGAVATAIAMTCAYGIYPVYLRGARVPRMPHPEAARAFFARRRLWAFAAVAVAFLACIPGLFRLKSDPSLFVYFQRGGDLRNGIEKIDARTGSTPIDYVVHKADGTPIRDQDDYRRMWALQKDLEADPDVGVTLSLPVMVAEGEHRFGAVVRMMTLEKKLEFGLTSPIVPADIRQSLRTFLQASEDGKPPYVHVRYLLRMREGARTESRREVRERLEALAPKHGFRISYVSGLYDSMGELSELVMTSVWRGLAGLLALFAIVSFVVARHPGVACSMSFGLLAIAGILLGVFGWARVPLDIISATATNVAIGIAIDGMIHLVCRARRGATWGDARFSMAAPVLGSALIVAGGFAIFALSSFPPTMRFGLFVVLGTALSAFVVLFVLPQPFQRRDTLLGKPRDP